MDQTIEPAVKEFTSNEVSVYEHSTYEESSVLAGHPRRVWIDGGSLSEMKAKYPDAEVLDHSTKQEIVLPECPPDWFDPAYAGETW